MGKVHISTLSDEQFKRYLDGFIADAQRRGIKVEVPATKDTTWETPAQEASRLREDIEQALYQYAEALGFDAAHYPFTDFTKLMDDMESQERVEE